MGSADGRPAQEATDEVDLRLFDHPYASFLDRVEKPTRYTGREHGSRHKDWDSVEARVCLAFPDVYDIGMSHLGYRILYALLNDDPRTLAERCYAPWIDLRAELKKRDLPLVSLESGRPLCDFDVVGFSLQFELCHTNILGMLELGRIALRSADRGEDAPLVVAGGPVATHAEPVAPFFDAIVIGDGEKLANELALSWMRGKREGLNRQQRLRQLAQLTGVYVPSLYSTELDPQSQLQVVSRPSDPSIPFPIRRHLVENLADFPFPTGGPVGGPEAIFDRMSVEVARGCTEGCRFCQAGMIYRPVRERPPAQVIETVMASIASTGQDQVGLTSLSTADLSYVAPLVHTLADKTAPERVSLGVASLRAYGLGDDLLEDLRKVRSTGLTFAPEAGTQRLRDVINKNVTEEQLMDTAQRVFSRGWDRMKLYFILGLPTETDEDVEGIASVGRHALDVGRRVSRKRVTVTVSTSVHVPKPHTPFQWCAMDSLPEIRRKQELLKQRVRGARGLELRMHDSTASVLECIMARGDRRMADVIEHAYRAGALFDSWDDQYRPDLWDAALAEFGIERADYLGTLPVTARLPWDHIDVGLEPDFLPKQYRLALQDRPSPPCGKPVGLHVHHTNIADAAADTRKLVCYHCGVACDLTAMREQRLGYLADLGANEPAKRRMPVLQPSPAVSEPAAAEDSATTTDELTTVDAPSEPNAESTAGEPVSASLVTAALEPEKKKRAREPSPESFRPAQAGGLATPWRLRFTKIGPIALLGHLDLIRELPRTFRRAGLRIAYSKGFHPKPDLSFAPALSLGVASLDEWVDAQIMDAPSADELLARLALAAPEGLQFLAAEPLPPRAVTLSKQIRFARYVIALSRHWVQEQGGAALIEQKIAEFMAQDSLIIVRRIDGIGKRIDVRRFVTSLKVAPDAEELIAKSGLVGELFGLELEALLEPSGSVKAAEVVRALFNNEEVPHRSVRVALLSEGHIPLMERPWLWPWVPRPLPGQLTQESTNEAPPSEPASLSTESNLTAPPAT